MAPPSSKAVGSKEGAERRVHPRVHAVLSVDFESAHNFYSGRTRDISVGGLFIESEYCPSVGTRLAVEIQLLGDRVHADAEVAWVLLGTDGVPTGMGLRFLDLSVEAQRCIGGFMALRAPVPFEMSADEGPPAAAARRSPLSFEPLRPRGQRTWPSPMLAGT